MHGSNAWAGRFQGAAASLVGGWTFSGIFTATWDVLLEASRPGATPFLVVGVGMFRTHETFFDDSVTSAEGGFTAGGGIRARLSDRVSAGVDARVGWEPHIRIGGFAAIRRGR